jgi:hypothetical protein
MKGKLAITIALTIIFSLVAVSGGWLTPVYADGMTGAIWTTDSTGEEVNENVFYESKEDVYLNGGPKGNGGGLPDGDYYIQVTDPSGGTVLGRSYPNTVTVSNGKFPYPIQLWSFLFSASSGFSLNGYDDTPNEGGEYKVWASMNLSFERAKTDNFKVKNAFVPPVVSGYKWNDQDGDGIWDEGEPALEDWTIKATKGEVVKTDVTGSDGSYSFEFNQEELGEWTISEVLKDDWQQTCPASPGNHVVNLQSGTSETGKNFGNQAVEEFVPPVVSGYKWNDQDGDGIWDEGEPALKGWTIKAVRIVGGNSERIETAVETTKTDITDGNGYYEFSFTENEFGDWTISEVLKDDWQQTYPASPGNHVVTVQSDIYETDKNFGNKTTGGGPTPEPSTVSGYKWNDKNGNGIWDEGEPALAGWTIKAVRIVGGNSERIETAVETTKTDITDGNGYYEFSFNENEFGDWTISEVLQTGWKQTCPASPGTYTVTVQSETTVADKNFGNKKKTTGGGGGTTPTPTEVPPEPPAAAPPEPPIVPEPPAAAPPPVPVEVPPAPPAAAPPLPHTGGNYTLFYLLGTVLLAAGALTRRLAK